MSCIEAMDSLQFVHGLTTTNKKENIINMSAIDAIAYVESHHDLNEIVFADGKHCRAFVDIDGCLPLETSTEDFDMTNQMILMALQSIDFGTPFSITTSSKHGNKDWRDGSIKNKLSYGLVFMERCGSKKAVKTWTQSVIAPIIKENLSHIVPFFIKEVDKDIPETNYLDYDAGVYRTNGKMRCVHSTKPNENRPRIIHSEHSLLDTMITYVPSVCVALPEVADEPTNAVVSLPADDNVLYNVVMSLSSHRFNDRKEWITVGQALFNEGMPCEIWDEFSKQSSKWCFGECQRTWRGFKTGSLTQRTLWKMLKEDNPEKFKTLWSSYANPEKAYELLLEPSHQPHAQHFVNCCPDDYLYDKGTGWWSLQHNNTWSHSGKNVPPTLLSKVSRVLFQECGMLSDIIRKKLGEENTVEVKEMYQNRFKKVNKSQQSVLTTGFCKSVIEFCLSFYAEQTEHLLQKHTVDNIHMLMDANPMLFAFQNAVYDFTLEEGKAVGKREIRPTDYIRTTCGYSYPTSTPKIQKEVEESLRTIWSKQVETEDGEEIVYGDDGDTYEYTMRMLSTTLCGVRWCEAFYIMTGSGRNGKGLLFELLQSVLGSYYYEAPVEVLTTKPTDSTSANPHIFNMMGKRMYMTTEPEANEKLQEGAIKKYTGGDKATGRLNYQDPTSFKPQCFLGIQCNNVPLVNGMTRAGMLRNNVIPFPFEFCSEPTSARQKKSNPDIKNRLCKSPEWRDAMFFLLLDRFESIRGKGNDDIVKPSLVVERTSQYMTENNAVGLWWNEHYVRSEKDSVLSKEAFQSFRGDTQSQLTDKKFKEALGFNLIEIKKISSGVNKDKMGVKGWKRIE
jgi:putative DNA primase/helicase